ncbi:hypothetical protein [Haloarcula litorea]|uniref:hypothetical protein n=1 Tax=Haloarcula litorea TaxID=3032579 RepID=UPI0023E86324|nr:hypothetical protein [Halomicroarcula sp. GDY20]
MESALDEMDIDMDLDGVEDVGVSTPSVEEMGDGTEVMSAQMTLLEPVEDNINRHGNITLRGTVRDNQWEVEVRKRPVCPSCRTVMGGQGRANKLHGRCTVCRTRTCENCAGRCEACEVILCQDHRFGYGPHQAAYCDSCLQQVKEEVEFQRRLEVWEKEFQAWQEQVQHIRQLEEAELQKELELKKQQMKQQAELEKEEMQHQRGLMETAMEQETKREEIQRKDERQREEMRLDHEESMRQKDIEERRLDKEWEQQDWEIERERKELEFQEDEHRWEKADKMMDMVEGMIDLQDEYKDEDSGVVEVESEVVESAEQLPDI